MHENWGTEQAVLDAFNRVARSAARLIGGFIRAFFVKAAAIACVALLALFLLQFFLGVLTAGGGAGVSGLEAAYRAAALEVSQGFEEHAPPWGLLEAIDIAAGDSKTDPRGLAYALRPLPSYRDSLEVTSYVNPETGEVLSVSQTVSIIDQVETWAGRWQYVYQWEDDGTRAYEKFVRADFVLDWSRFEAVLSGRLGLPAVHPDDRDFIVAAGMAATYGEPDDLHFAAYYVGHEPAAMLVGDYAFPVLGRWRVTSPFGAFRGHLGWHNGLDLGAPEGTPLAAVTSGRVALVYSARGGNCLVIAGDDGLRYLYAHLSGYAVRDGQRVEKGQVVGYVGNTGFSTGPHLHIEFILPDGTRVDPAPYLGIRLHGNWPTGMVPW